MIDLHTEVVGLLPLKKQIEILSMPLSMRRRVLYRVGKQVEKDSRKRVRAQQDLEGRPFAPRKQKKRGKMLSKMVASRRMFIRATGTEAVLGFKGRTGFIAAKHQQGFTETVQASQLPGSAASLKDPATPRQARALIQENFRVKRKAVKGLVRPTQRYITEHYTVAQAGAILRALRGRSPKKSWRVRLPARSFLGATDAEVTRHIDTIINQVTKGIQNVAR